MSRVRVNAFTISIDGFGAGPDQSREAPLGVGGESLHTWMVGTATFRRMVGGADGATGPDDDMTAASLANIGAWIMGRNMFGPVRGEWPDDTWRGWWGDSPPYHTDVFVLTHHPRAPIEMAGGTTFHFVTDGMHAALERARASAGDRDIRIGGGVNVIRQYVRAGLVDSMHLALSPVLLGRGEHLLDGIDLVALGYTVTERLATPDALHVTLAKEASPAPA
jgi:dihydrofolate reductase